MHTPTAEEIRAEFDAAERLRVTNRLEEYALLIRKLQSEMAVIQ